MMPTVVKTVRARPWQPKAAAAPVHPAERSAAFGEYVLGQLDGPVLRYSQRLALLKEAGRRGLGRFEANLVIASVLHGRGMAQEYEMRPAGSGWMGAVMTGVVVQAALAAGAWWVWH